MSEELLNIISHAIDVFWPIYATPHNHDSPKKVIRDHRDEIIQKLKETGCDVDKLDDQFFDKILPYSFYKSFLTSPEIGDCDVITLNLASAISEVIDEEVISPITSWRYSAERPYERKVHVKYNVVGDPNQSKRYMTVVFTLTPDNPIYMQNPMPYNVGDLNNRLRFAYGYIETPARPITNVANAATSTNNMNSTNAATSTDDTIEYRFVHRYIPEDATMFTRNELLRTIDDHLQQWL